MAKITGLDIPSGLETLFARALQSKSNLLTDVLGLTIPKQNYTKRKRTAARSPIVLLQPYYIGLSGGQKDMWTFYWEVLPFSEHTGNGGWPGSGFAAFVYVNAPRLKAGLSLILDAPFSGAYDIVFGLGAQSQEISGSATGWQHSSVLFTADATDEGIGSIGFSAPANDAIIANVDIRESFPAVGGNIVSNGDFAAGSTDWIKIDGFPKYPGHFAYLPGGSIILQNVTLVDGYSYLFKFDYLPVTIL